MKVASVKAYLLSPGEPKHFILVKVQTDEGICGWGEAYAQWNRDEAIVCDLERLGCHLIGRDPFHIRHFTQAAVDDVAMRRPSMEFCCALSGLELALWDIVGKAVGRPVSDLMGGPCRRQVRVYANCFVPGATSADDILNASERAACAGFTAVKVYPLNLLPRRRYLVTEDAIRQAVDVVGRVRRALGPDIGIALDFARYLRPMQALDLARRVAEYKPMWLEEPCTVDNVQGLAEIRSQTGIPVVVGEVLYHKGDFRRVLEGHAADILNPDICCVGGILEMQDVAAMAEPYGVALSPHNYNTMAVGLAATVHASAMAPNFLIAEYFPLFASIGRAIGGCLEPRRGLIDVPTGPGLGVEVNEAALGAYPFREFTERRIRLVEGEAPQT